jgi:hypothetical protein
LRNNIIFGDEKCGIKSSTEYLDNYPRTLTDIREGHEETDVKGKKPVMEQGHAKINSTPKPSEWKPPDTGWQCLNVDASYVQNTGEASWGAVIRDEAGQVISSAWSLIPNCANAETAEAIACWEGIKHSISLRNTKLIVESDCASLIAKLGKPEDDMSHTLSIISDIQRLRSLFEDIKFYEDEKGGQQSGA